ncbi:D-stereospecific phenylhydantoinase [Candidatus Moduliflexus flocculans]|uniref:D-stereospecific phenylhydantoinase n=1 Tax=Candidatus Moduliflexus flocculans TaxID=1499966 RepID=A0A0S6VUH9_9BACT|nr:D-stereospecific phenylhydantoinase [Candidatus Moduliflexus flocculans]
MNSALLKNATIITASQTIKADILARDGIIEQIGRHLDAADAQSFDLTGRYLLPGGIDVHTHLDMPLGDIRSCDDFTTGTVAAACGGTTTIIDYAAHAHGETMAQGLDAWHQRAEGKAVIDYGFHLTLSEFTDRTLRDMERIVEAGVTSFKVFTAYPGRMMIDDAAIFRVLQQAKEIGALVCVHCENGQVIDALIHDALAAGQTAPKYHPLTRPAIAEREAAHRVISLAEMADAPVYIVHVSSGAAIEQIAQARLRGVPVYAETCPQYLFLSAELYDGIEFEGAKYVMSPPLREKLDQDALWQAVRNRMIDVIGTDHCPFHFQSQKTLGRDDFTKIPNGGPGIETRLNLMFTGGVSEQRISLNHFVDIVSTQPAKLFGLYPQKGEIAPGSDADFVVINPEHETFISAITQHSIVDYSLYEGMRVKGTPEKVFARGELIVENGRFLGKPGAGRFLKRQRSSHYAR